MPYSMKSQLFVTGMIVLVMTLVLAECDPRQTWGRSSLGRTRTAISAWSDAISISVSIPHAWAWVSNVDCLHTTLAGSLIPASAVTTSPLASLDTNFRRARFSASATASAARFLADGLHPFGVPVAFGWSDTGPEAAVGMTVLTVTRSTATSTTTCSWSGRRSTCAGLGDLLGARSCWFGRGSCSCGWLAASSLWCVRGAASAATATKRFLTVSW